MDVAAIRIEIENRVSDDLPRTVVSDVASAARFMELDSAGIQLSGRRQDMTATTVAAHAERQHVRMLHEQQNISHMTPLALFYERSLEGERLSIGLAAESSDLNTPAHLVF